MIFFDEKPLPANFIAVNFMTALTDDFSVVPHAGAFFNERIGDPGRNRLDVDDMKRLFAAVGRSIILIPRFTGSRRIPGSGCEVNP